MGELAETVLHTLDGHHRLSPLIDSQCLVFYRFHCHINLWQSLYLGQRRVVRRHGLTFGRQNLQLRVEGSEEGGHHVVEAVEHGERDDEGHRRNGHTYDGDGADDVDGVRRLLREKIPSRYKEWEIHISYLSPLTSSITRRCARCSLMSRR